MPTHDRIRECSGLSVFHVERDKCSNVAVAFLLAVSFSAGCGIVASLYLIVNALGSPVQIHLDERRDIPPPRHPPAKSFRTTPTGRHQHSAQVEYQTRLTNTNELAGIRVQFCALIATSGVPRQAASGPGESVTRPFTPPPDSICGVCFQGTLPPNQIRHELD